MRLIGAIGVPVLCVLGAASASASQGRPPAFRENPGVYFGPDAYPTDAWRAGEQGRVVARLAIDVTGKVISCLVTTSSGFAALDQATCRIALEHIAFFPATDRRGRPIPATYALPVRWVLPGPDAQMIPPAETLVEMTMSIDSSGEVVACNARAEPALPAQIEPCSEFPVGRQSGINWVRDGRRVGGTMTRTYRVHVSLDP